MCHPEEEDTDRYAKIAKKSIDVQEEVDKQPDAKEYSTTAENNGVNGRTPLPRPPQFSISCPFCTVALQAVALGCLCFEILRLRQTCRIACKDE